MLETHQIDKLKRLEKTRQLFKGAKVLESCFGDLTLIEPKVSLFRLTKN